MGTRNRSPLRGVARGCCTAALLLPLLTGCARSSPRQGAAVELVQPQPGGHRAQHASRVRPHLVVLGDSVAAGAGCSCIGFDRRLAGRLATAAGRPAELSNLGQDGLTSAGLRQQLDDPHLAELLHTATLVTVTIGANDFDPDLAGRSDCFGGDTLPCYQTRLAQLGPTLAGIVTRIRALQPRHGRLLVTGYWNVFLDGAVGMARGSSYVITSGLLTREVNAVVARECVRAGATYVDLYGPFETRSLPDLTALLAPDGDHPSARGHELIATAMSFAAGLPS